jgi:anti-sigma regulatory factor (Ser/Thr protein kinase)
VARGDETAVVRLFAAPRDGKAPVVGTWGHLSLALPATTSALPTIRSALRRWLVRAGVNEETSADVVVAVWEACANAVQHPVDPRSREIVVEADAQSAFLSVSVRDSGHWHERPADTSRGFGLTMVNGLMDVVLIQRTPDGTEVRMVRSLRGDDGGARPAQWSEDAAERPGGHAPGPGR